MVRKGSHYRAKHPTPTYGWVCPVCGAEDAGLPHEEDAQIEFERHAYRLHARNTTATPVAPPQPNA